MEYTNNPMKEILAIKTPIVHTICKDCKIYCKRCGIGNEIVKQAEQRGRQAGKEEAIKMIKTYEKKWDNQYVMWDDIEKLITTLHKPEGKKE